MIHYKNKQVGQIRNPTCFLYSQEYNPTFHNKYETADIS